MHYIVLDTGTINDAPTLAEIEAFSSVVSHGSFSQAAAHLGVAKSSVSRRIASIEAKLGARLLQRSTRRMALTEVGTAYHERIVSLLEGLGQATDVVLQMQSEPRGELRLTAPSDFASALARLVAAFGREYPKVFVHVELTQRTIDLVGEGFDAAIRAGHLRDSTLVARRLGHDRLVLTATPEFLGDHGMPETTAELAALPWVLFRGQHRRASVRVEGPEGLIQLDVRGPLSGNQFGFIREAVLAGVGVGALPRLSCQEEIQSGQLRCLSRWNMVGAPLHLVYPSRRFTPPKLLAFRDFAVRWFAREEIT